jgi:protein-L-isoaspartate(D-aspartate) O-methyltransferase
VVNLLQSGILFAYAHAAMNLEQARSTMVESQIRTWEVLDQRVLDTILAVKREAFTPPQYTSLAFVDMEIPLGHGESMLSPKLEARMLQELTLKPADRVLEVGTGSGYMTALLATLSAHVYSVDLYEDFTRDAGSRLSALGIANVTLETGDAHAGWARHAPYDAILLTGSVPILPADFKMQLRVGGRLLAVVGEPPIMTAVLYTCVAEGALNEVGLFETCIAPLRNVARPDRFVF